MGNALWKEDIEDGVKLLESIILNCCVKVKTADFHKIGLKKISERMTFQRT